MCEESKTEIINKIVIIGNGFDLANDLPTSYNDFILWYLKDYLEKAYAKGSIYSDGLISTNSCVSKTNFSVFDLNIFRETLETNFKHGKIDSLFLELILKDVESKNWVDIETLYFKEILGIYKSKSDENRKLQKLNNDLKIITSKLVEYLKTITKTTKIQPLRGITFRDFFGCKNEDEKSFFINFNYTNTVSQYENHVKNSVSIQIHGYLHDDGNNPIIFGYGDDTNEHYKTIENLEENLYMQHFKSFWYSKTDKYEQLLNCLESGKYEVYILGHSCGLSDRVLLKTIFEHNSCNKIHVFHHGKNLEQQKKNHFEKVIQISRHFDDKAKMRKLVSKFNPQYCFN